MCDVATKCTLSRAAPPLKEGAATADYSNVSSPRGGISRLLQRFLSLKGTSRAARRHRELIVMEASAALVAAKSRADVETAAVESIARMVPGGGVRATILSGGEKQMRVVAAAGDEAEAIVGHTVDLGAEVGERLVRGETVDTTHVPAEERAGSPLPVKLGGLFSAPLVTHGELAGAIMVTADRRLPHGFEDSFRTLASHVSLALEAIALTDDLRRSEGRFRAIVQNSSDMVLIVDGRGRVLYSSPSNERILGHTEEMFKNMESIEDAVHPDDRELSRAFFIEALKSPQITTPACWRVQHANGSRRHIQGIHNNLPDRPQLPRMKLPPPHATDPQEPGDQPAHRPLHDAPARLPNRPPLT